MHHAYALVLGCLLVGATTAASQDKPEKLLFAGPDDAKPEDLEKAAKVMQARCEQDYLDRVQVENAIAALDHHVRFCKKCNTVVLVPLVNSSDARCPRCLQPLVWMRDDE